jgi:NADH:flavin oxidoreductase / NADH oxidase family
MTSTGKPKVDLFTPIKVGPLVLPNRIVMAPLTRNRAGPGDVPRELNVTYYAQRASAGLILTEATPVSPLGHGYPATPGIHTKAQVAGWTGSPGPCMKGTGASFCSSGTSGGYSTRLCCPPVRCPWRPRPSGQRVRP